MPMPDLAVEQCEGGHCVAIVGYSDQNKWVIVRNSWGTGWGKNGYFFMPYEFLLNANECSDFWVIQKVM